jgi:transposase
MSIAETQNKLIFASDEAGSGSGVSDFSSVFVTIPKIQYIQLQWESKYWKSQHGRALERENALKIENENLNAQIRDLKQRLYGRKTEKGGRKDKGQKEDPKPKKPRGQQEGGKSSGRKLLAGLPLEEEFVDIPDDRKVCRICGLEHKEFPKTEDSDVVEVEVRGYIRRICRKQYTPGCQCEELPGLITAPPPSRLINKGKFGISIWLEILLNKFLYLNPTNRLLQSWADSNIVLAQGTLTGGLQKLKPLFTPLLGTFSEKVLSEDIWNVDETNYKVFVKIEGKAGHGWYLWIFRSKSGVIYILDPSRSSEVPKNFFGADAEGIVVCDRYSAYKKLIKTCVMLQLAFCWAHVRRDFLELGRSCPELDLWCQAWVERIGTLYHLNKLRLEVIEHEDSFKERNQELCAHLSEMKKIRDKELKDESLHEKAGKVLGSLKNHWKGLTRFVGNPGVPMDNNRAENAARGPKVGAKGYYGAGSEWSGEFAAMMFSILMTIKYLGLNPRLWLSVYLDACAKNGNQAPDDLKNFLPWSMDKKRLEELKKSGVNPPLPP